jgi:hypothetical protein
LRLSLLALSVLALAAVPSARADSLRTLNLDLSGDARAEFSVENLAGAMHVVPGTGDHVSVVVNVHGGTDALADSVRLVQVTNEKGVPTLRVRYPLDQHQSFRYPGGGHDDGGGNWFASMFGGNSNTKYDGRRVSVSSSHGVLLYADVQVSLPRGDARGHFKNAVGPMDGHDVHGRLLFDTGSGDVTVERVGGDVTADTGSGNVKARTVSGRFKCDTGSGDCDIKGFEGEALVADTGSGRVTIDGAAARRVSADTGSGDVVLRGADAEDVSADTGSGDVEIEITGTRLASVKADTGSGSVTVRMPRDVSFEARADMGSGELVSHFADAQPIVNRREVVGYRRGDGHVKIDVDTGSGDVVLEPGK